jgi:hypothetical protein
MAEQSVPPHKARKQEPTRFDPSEFPDFWEDFAENPPPIRQDDLVEYLRLREQIHALRMDLEDVAGQVVELLVMDGKVAPGPYTTEVVDGHLEVQETSQGGES